MAARHQNEEQLSQELNLNGTIDTFRAVGGVYYFHENDSQNVQSQAPTAVKSTFPDVVTDSELFSFRQPNISCPAWR